MNWNFLGHNWHLFGHLAILAFVALLVFATCMFVYTTRLRQQEGSPLAERLGGYPSVLRKVRKREPMSPDELHFARQAIADRGSLWAFSIPATIFSLGCFYVLGSMEQLHGATPSERTFLGVIPMISSINITAQVLRMRRLKGRLPQAS
ncbi:hypothetical protein BST43_14700 [Mycobacteroides saopaulense]|uniref:Uncharacterized protein n=1 Tax=Mycobacteroides saopaulense TaxID=1578165 RepID=A0A1S4W5Z1_9MYCO|nr:hypothetical protein [Mycobacteroides saopaulense]ALR13679.1 hypothetical protein MYCSP_22225 [Mycobacteroides saopaulense]ORB55449.1 hypothetical protein BST43_14700 [Mycobacteroides saopaulense]